MHTTVIGSYPLDYDKLGSEAIRQSVEDQISAGVEIVSDGQTRSDILSVYESVLQGIKNKEGKMRITGKITSIENSKLIEDFKFAKSIAGKREVKAILTGPSTLLSFSVLNTIVYKGFWDKNLYKDVSKALLDIALELEKAGAKHFQIDEPYFSVKMSKEFQEAVENIATQLHGEVSLHVCGDITKIFDQLLKIRGVRILSHAFAGNPENLSVISRDNLESSNKILGFGCINVSSEELEEEKEVIELIKKGADLVGPENMIIHPDCGMRSLSREIAKEKLLVMCKAVKELNLLI